MGMFSFKLFDTTLNYYNESPAVHAECQTPHSTKDSNDIVPIAVQQNDEEPVMVDENTTLPVMVDENIELPVMVDKNIELPVMVDENIQLPIWVEQNTQLPMGTPVPTIDEPTVINFLTNLKRTAQGPDGLPYWLWKDFAQPLAPIITKVFNLSIEQQCVPLMWKLANVNPIPKESPLTECNQSRPISLTNIMRLFERAVYKQEIASVFKSVVGRDQFAYKEGTNTTDALIKCLHHWLKWLHEGAGSVRVISFEYKKAFDSVSHNIICQKLKTLELNPYITNWIISFLANKKQRVVVDGIETVYVDINKGVPQGTVLGPFLFSLMVNDIKPMNAQNNQLVKFADDITTSAPVKSGSDSAEAEAESIQNWSEANQMTLNLSKTWEMVVHCGSVKLLPAPIAGINRKSWLKLLGVTFQENPCCWDLHIDDLLSKASGRMYILRVCRCYGYSADQLNKLFDSLIMSLFYYSIEVWGSALQKKDLDRIDKFFRRAHRYGYTMLHILMILQEFHSCIIACDLLSSGNYLCIVVKLLGFPI